MNINSATVTPFRFSSRFRTPTPAAQLDCNLELSWWFFSSVLQRISSNGCRMPVARLFVPWTIRTMDFSYLPLTFRTVVRILVSSTFLSRVSKVAIKVVGLRREHRARLHCKEKRFQKRVSKGFLGVKGLLLI